MHMNTKILTLSIMIEKEADINIKNRKNYPLMIIIKNNY